MYEGFDNLSLMMGSTPRIRGKVTDWKSGFKEGGKAVSLGLWDGITGIVTEPVDGARREGFTGFGKGVGRGCERCFPSGNGCSADGTVANLINRPLAGSLGLFVLPTRGIRESVRSALGTHLDPHSVLRGPREALTRSAMSELSEEYRQRLLDTFAVLETETRARRRERNRTQWILMANKDEREKERIERHRRDAEKKERRDMLKRVKGTEEEEKAAQKERQKAEKEAEKRKEKEEKEAEKEQEKVEKLRLKAERKDKGKGRDEAEGSGKSDKQGRKGSG
jgi:hypothetical protein